MTHLAFVLLALKASIMAQVFAIGLRAAPRELTHLFRHPEQMLRSFLSMAVVMPIVAVAIAKIFALNKAVEIVLVALALSPVPPLFPKKLVKAGGGHAYVMALLFTASFFAIAWIPLACIVLDKISPAPISASPFDVARLVFVSIIVPAGLGMLTRLLLPRLAKRVAAPITTIAGILMLLGGVLILAGLSPILLRQIGNGTVIGIVVFIALGLLVGHVLGGPTQADKSVLALATASRHPGIAIAIANLNFPDEKAVPAVTLLYLILELILTPLYFAWRSRTILEAAHETDVSLQAHRH